MEYGPKTAARCRWRGFLHSFFPFWPGWSSLAFASPREAPVSGFGPRASERTGRFSSTSKSSTIGSDCIRLWGTFPRSNSRSNPRLRQLNKVSTFSGPVQRLSMQIEIPCRIGVSEEAPQVPVSLTASGDAGSVEVSIHIDVAFPHGPVSLEASFYRRDLEEFARKLVSFAREPQGRLYLPDWDGKNALHLYVIDPQAQAPSVAMGGLFERYLVSDDALLPMGSTEETPWALSICFEAMVMPSESLEELAKFLHQFARDST